MIADSIVGKLIMGNNLIISNSSNTFEVNENGLSISNDNMSIRMSPDIGLDIARKTAGDDLSVFKVDENGNLTITGGKIIVGDGSNTGYIIDGNNGSITSLTKDENGDPLFLLTRDGHMNTSGVRIDGNEVPKPSGEITPIKGNDGVVEDSGNGLTGGIWDCIKTLVTFFLAGPYVAILNLIGRKDSDGWRNIWNYYSRRNIAQMMEDFTSAGYQIIDATSLDSAIAKNNSYLDTIYIGKNSSDLTYYKTWTDTDAYLKENYYTKGDINTKFDITESNALSWKTITVGGQTINVLTKS